MNWKYLRWEFFDQFDFVLLCKPSILPGLLSSKFLKEVVITETIKKLDGTKTQQLTMSEFFGGAHFSWQALRECLIGGIGGLLFPLTHSKVSLFSEWLHILLPLWRHNAGFLPDQSSSSTLHWSISWCLADDWWIQSTFHDKLYSRLDFMHWW